MTACETLTLRLELEPVDTLFFRDARPFEAASRASSGLPMPQTLTGALRTAAIESHGIDPADIGNRMRDGASFNEVMGTFGPTAKGIAGLRVRGPWFRRETDAGPLMPVPANLRRDRKTDALIRLDPLAAPPPGWRPPETGMLPLWWRGREGVEAVEGYLTPTGLRQFLQGRVPALTDIVPATDLYGFEDRTGIGIDVQVGTARERQIYGVRMLALRRGVRMVCELSGYRDALLPLRDNVHLVRFGGESRHVRIHAEEGNLPGPGVVSDDRSGRLILFTTPACFDGWRPSNLRVVSAAVPGYSGVSGWDLARGGPKPNRFMVRAGSVYFLAPGDKPPPDGFVTPEDAQTGWGDFLEGNWNYA